MEAGGSSGEKKRKKASSKEIDIKFKVMKDADGFKLLKSGYGSALTVNTISEMKSNSNGLKMMFSLNHPNILSMKALGPKVEDQFIVFIEKGISKLNEMIMRRYYAPNGQIPSTGFQNFVRGVVEGIDFLRRNDLYHGNLNWHTTLYKPRHVAKLCNFRTRDGVSKEDAKWEDWLGIRDMLVVISNDAASLNGTPSFALNIFCGEIDALIELLTNSNRDMLPKIKDAVLAEVFFWGKRERSNFIMTVVSELIHKPAFKEKINKASIVELRWDSHDKNRPLNTQLNAIFNKLMEHCNQFRRFKFDNEKQSDCVELACAAYTHEDEIKGADESVDTIFHVRYPNFFVGLKGIVKAHMDASGTSC